MANVKRIIKVVDIVNRYQYYPTGLDQTVQVFCVIILTTPEQEENVNKAKKN